MSKTTSPAARTYGSASWGPDIGISARDIGGCAPGYRVTYYEPTYGMVVNEHLSADVTRKLVSDLDCRGCMYRIHIERRVTDGEITYAG
jgi:hypothetical protein